MIIRVRIDRVVIDGLEVRWPDRAAIERAIAGELRSGLAGADVPRAGVRVRRLVAEPIGATETGTPVSLGRAIGRSAGEAIGRTGRP